MNYLLLPEISPGRFLQADAEHFLVRFITPTDQSQNLLVTLATHRLESNDDGDILAKTVVTKVNLVMLGRYVCLGLALMRGSEPESWVWVNKDHVSQAR
jgi:hypothetical protein